MTLVQRTIQNNKKVVLGYVLAQNTTLLLSTAPSLLYKQVNLVLQIHHLWPESHSSTTNLDTGPGRIEGRKNSGLITKT